MSNLIAINTNNAPTPIGPYTQAIKISNIIFVSGQIGICPDTGKISDNIYDQTQQTLQNIKYIIKKADFQIQNIVKTTIFITNINDLPEVNISYTHFFKKQSHYKNINFPARSCVEVSKLPKNAKIEIEAIAITPLNQT